MPASARYSAATRQLVAELRALGYSAGCRAVEQWAAWGLAPAPERVSLGRRGTTSRYPDGTVEQYAAVASVMRRGQDWRAAGLMLIGRGHLITREATLRLLLAYLFSPDDEIDDPLQFADDHVMALTENPLFRRLAKVAQRNIRAAKIVDPITGVDIDPFAAAVSVMTRGLASMLGEAMPRDAAEETAAAWGMISADLPLDVREHRIDFVNALSDNILNFERLSFAARTVDPVRLQAAIREFRSEVEGPSQQLLGMIPSVHADMLAIAVALTVIVLEDLGGAAWLETVSPGITAAEERHRGIDTG
jgi:hypothetical protein